MRAAIDLTCLGCSHADGVRVDNDALYNLLFFGIKDFDEVLIQLQLVLL